MSLRLASDSLYAAAGEIRMRPEYPSGVGSDRVMIVMSAYPSDHDRSCHFRSNLSLYSSSRCDGPSDVMRMACGPIIRGILRPLSSVSMKIVES